MSSLPTSRTQFDYTLGAHRDLRLASRGSFNVARITEPNDVGKGRQAERLCLRANHLHLQELLPILAAWNRSLPFLGSPSSRFANQGDAASSGTAPRSNSRRRFVWRSIRRIS